MGGHIAINPSRPQHFEGWERATTKQFIEGMHRQFVNDYSGLPFTEKRTLGYNDILSLAQEAYQENNQGLATTDEGWIDSAYPHIGFVGDLGAFVNQPGPRFEKYDAGEWVDNCAPDSLLANLPADCTITEKLVPGEAQQTYIASINCPASALDLFLPQGCLIDTETDGTITLDLAPPLHYPYEGFEPLDKNNPDGPKIGTFNRQVTGTRTFDLNTDGIAHVGLFPDILADARDNYGADLKPFFNSAEAFIRLWEKVYVADAESEDSDGDGIGDDIDTCPGYDDNLNADGDILPDGCDFCPNDPLNDDDNDSVCGDIDICPGYDDRLDMDSDTIPDDCDFCPNDPLNDSDGDGICGDVDNCPDAVNPDQADYEHDGIGDVCDPDDDNDGVPDSNDACPYEDATGFDADSNGCIDSLAGLVEFLESLVTTGDISENLSGSLSVKIENASASELKENNCAAINKIEAYQNQINAKAEKEISRELAEQLIQYGDNLISQLSAGLPAGVNCDN